jgi:hypothetical protein
MRFQVQTIRQAERDYNGIVNYIAQRSRSGTVAWAAAYKHALTRLQRAADTFPLAAEDEFVDFQLREALFKTRRGLQYRILFTIRGNLVVILHVRGPGQSPLAPDEVREY